MPARNNHATNDASMKESKHKSTYKQPQKKTVKKKSGAFLGILRDTVMAMINIVVVLLFIFSAKITHFSPEQWSLSAYPNYLLLGLALLNIVFFVYWLLRWRWWALMSLLAFALCFSEQKDWFPINVNQQEYDLNKKEYKILTYNTMQFSHMLAHRKDAPNKVLKYLQDSQADILCLQETLCHSSEKYLRQEDVLKALSDYPYQKRLPGKSLMSMWVFSKYPILKCERIDFESAANASYYCDIQLDGKIVRVINNHLESNKLTKEDKSLYKEIIDSPDKESISNVAHALNNKLSPAAVMRARQAEAVAKVIAESPYPVMACGDFNDIPNSYTYRTMSKSLVDAWRNNNNGLGISFHEKFYLFRIDYILHSPAIHTYHTKVDKVNYSDHYPLWTYFQL